VMKVVVSDSQRQGSLFVPIHWSVETSSSSCVGDLIAPFTDPHSGQPEAKATPAAIAAAPFASHGFARVPDTVALPPGTWWARVAVAEGTEYRIATSDGPMLWHDFAYRVLARDAHFAERLENGCYQAVAFIDGELQASLCLAPAESTMEWDPRLLIASETPEHASLHRHFTAGSAIEVQPILCACFQIGIGAVRDAVASGASTVAEIGERLQAGTNCGSCLPELKKVIRECAL
jgi:assimilatory nitrate reductase catalytic subunit